KVDITNEYPQTQWFQGSVDVNVDNKVQRVWLKPQETNTFTFDSPTKPRLVNFDNESTWLKEMKFDKSTDDLLYQMVNDKDVLGRRWAMNELQTRAVAGTDRERILTAMTSASEKDPFWRLRRAAFSVLAAIVSPDPKPGQTRPPVKLDAATEALAIRFAKDPRSLIRADAIRLLGESQDAKYVQTYLGALNDPSYGVIDAAALALALTKDPRAFDALSKLVSTPSWHGRIANAGLNGLATLGDKRALDVGLKAAADTNLLLRVRRTAFRVIAASGKGDDRAYPFISDELKLALDARDDNTVLALVRAIVAIADPRGQQAFDTLKARYKDNPQYLGFITQQEQAFKAAAKPQ
ncbi:MAG TPA: HEAT repeat domain-containing protein, partial [Pyrinomonadaceae bacterium]|nr:HEAT repeat domain-containing protein [Pyrinomonadaceae bacterium]